MSRNIVVGQLPGGRIENQRIEVVERKGIGHPDSIADGLAERISQALCQEYLDTFGSVAHHNTDEVQIIGGKSRPAFNGGNVIQPAYILLGGRATQSVNGDSINIHGIAMRTAKAYLRDNIAHLDVEEDVILDSRIGEGSTDLTSLYDRDSGVPHANDTSFGIGHAPFSETEQLVLSVEERLNSAAVKDRYPFIGEDVKVMANRDDDTINLTVAVALVDRYVDDAEDYADKKARIRGLVEDVARDVADRDVTVALNTADGDSEDELYLTVTGTSAEMGDDGSVGRGNRVSGLITPRRAMSLEASSGKNPVSHIGKIYNLLAHRIADQVVQEHDRVDEAHVLLLSQIGQPIDQPQIADIRLATDGTIDNGVRRSVDETAAYWLEHTNDVLEDVVQGNVRTF